MNDRIDDRHVRRIQLMQALFASTFSAESLELALAKHSPESELGMILNSLDELDAIITQAAPERPLKDINKVDLAILRLSMFESKHKKTPKKVLIDEAIELAKEFGAEHSSKFINGVLAKLLLDPVV